MTRGELLRQQRLREEAYGRWVFRILIAMLIGVIAMWIVAPEVGAGLLGVILMTAFVLVNGSSMRKRL